MRVEVAVLAADFWTRVGGRAGFPRDIERAAMIAVPVVVVKLPRLSSHAISGWLRARSIAAVVPNCKAEMAGCLVAHRGKGAIFLVGTDEPDEQRATVAHEVAHFLRHYVAVRERAIRALGPGIAEVLDGERPATFSERARSVIWDVPVGVHVHVLPREDRANVIGRFEDEADELALQLVAPYEEAVTLLRRMSPSSSARERRVALARHFGLPANWFTRYVPEPEVQKEDRLVSILAQLRQLRKTP